MDERRGVTGVAVNAVVSVDGAGRITHFNPAAERIFGHTRADVVGDRLLTLLAEQCHEPYRHQVDFLFSSEEAENAGRTIELVGRRKDGSEFPLEMCLVTWRSSAKALFTAVVRDISDRKQVEREREELLHRVEAMARTDELTGLANRRAWDEEVRRELARAGRADYPVCVVMLDLDNFKELNDEHGHQAGDALLREVGTAWRIVVRVTDFIARYGGDEFALLLADCPRDAAGNLVDRLQAALPEGHTCSAGLAYWDGAMTAEDLIARADAALYESKRARRDLNQR
jgi:diguanylate cyclase (GGDEF)-like protein/PAS domain S-box-containing protein